MNAVDGRVPALEVEGLVKHFPVGSRFFGGSAVVHAVEDVSFSLAPGEMLGLVGESGSGKSTVANCVVRLLEPTAGTIRLHGVDITHLSRRSLQPYRRQMHIVFQDPYSSLNPRLTCGQIVGEPLRLHRLAARKELDWSVAQLFDRVGLRPELRFRYPHELSGGQRQRVGLARALSVSPSVLVADEPVSALDVSVQASILNLLRDLQADMGFSCLLITHDLSTVEFLCDRVAVMYLGRIVESASVEDLFSSPKHPYTQALLSAAVVPDPELQRRRQRIILSGELPSPITPPSGCAFRTRCPLADRSAPDSVETVPELRDVGGGHHVACHLVASAGGGPRLLEEAVT
jgi:oligopeptide/dipeptide ABC transporter ATP-binding protein